MQLTCLTAPHAQDDLASGAVPRQASAGRSNVPTYALNLSSSKRSVSFVQPFQGNFDEKEYSLYVASFAISLGPVFWLLISEIYPTAGGLVLLLLVPETKGTRLKRLKAFGISPASTFRMIG